MLESISIKNIALIDEALVQFSEGLNVLTGETGAGKSMIIDSLGFALGEKTSRDIIRSGENAGSVEAVFYVSENQAVSNIEELGIEIDDGTLIISRKISDTGKTTTRINGQAVTTQTLRRITDELIDIHGQHEHQSLLNPTKQMDFVDGFCGDALQENKKLLEAEFKRYKDLRSQIDGIVKSIGDKESRLEFLEYRISELERVKLKNGEEEALLDEKKAVLSADKLSYATNTALDKLYDGTGAKSALDSVNESLQLVESAAIYDKKLDVFVERLYGLQEEIKDVSQELRRYQLGVDANPGRIDEIEERLNDIYIAKRKYGGSVENALESLSKMIHERDLLADSDFELDKLSKEHDGCLAKVTALCGKITGLREKGSKKMENLISGSLKELSMENAVLSVSLSRAEISPRGADRVELFLCANKGESAKPLAQIASGGEMSRVMLAIKSVAASQGTIETFIFDEIDQGTSGRTAQKVAEKMALLAAERQIICITHLPQIAAMADKHILIEKEADEEKTFTKIRALDESEIAGELSRLLGGAMITEQTLKAAAEMRELANHIKNKKSNK